MFLRNVDQTNSFCNETRLQLQVNDLGKNVILTLIITNKNIGDKTFIPRTNLVHSDTTFPFNYQRRQFPLSLFFNNNK